MPNSRTCTLIFLGKKSTLYVSYSTLYAYYTSFLWDFKFWKSINPIKSYADFPKNANFVSKMQLFVSKMPLSFSKKTIFLLKIINFSLKNDNFCHPVHLFHTVQLLTLWKSSTLYYYSKIPNCMAIRHSRVYLCHITIYILYFSILTVMAASYTSNC